MAAPADKNIRNLTGKWKLVCLFALGIFFVTTLYACQL
jgi:hypothetical protein